MFVFLLFFVYPSPPPPLSGSGGSFFLFFLWVPGMPIDTPPTALYYAKNSNTEKAKLGFTGKVKFFFESSN